MSIEHADFLIHPVHPDMGFATRPKPVFSNVQAIGQKGPTTFAANEDRIDTLTQTLDQNQIWTIFRLGPITG
jgi:hypothetical protein